MPINKAMLCNNIKKKHDPGNGSALILVYIIEPNNNPDEAYAAQVTPNL